MNKLLLVAMIATASCSDGLFGTFTKSECPDTSNGSCDMGAGVDMSTVGPADIRKYYTESEINTFTTSSVALLSKSIVIYGNAAERKIGVVIGNQVSSNTLDGGNPANIIGRYSCILPQDASAVMGVFPYPDGQASMSLGVAVLTPAAKIDVGAVSPPFLVPGNCGMTPTNTGGLSSPLIWSTYPKSTTSLNYPVFGIEIPMMPGRAYSQAIPPTTSLPINLFYTSGASARVAMFINATKKPEFAIYNKSLNGPLAYAASTGSAAYDTTRLIKIADLGSTFIPLAGNFGTRSHFLFIQSAPVLVGNQVYLCDTVSCETKQFHSGDKIPAAVVTRVDDDEKDDVVVGLDNFRDAIGQTYNALAAVTLHEGLDPLYTPIAISSLAGYQVIAMTAGEINGDGKEDMAVLLQRSGTTNFAVRVYLHN